MTKDPLDVDARGELSDNSDEIVLSGQGEGMGACHPDELGNEFRPIHVIPVSAGKSRNPRGASMTFGEIVYRCFEYCLAICLFVVALPVMLVEAIVIRVNSPGPVLFRQQRVKRSQIIKGKHLVGRKDLIPPAGGFLPETEYYVPQTFTFLKFRTMYVDAQERYPELYNYNYTPEQFAKARVKLREDPRVTQVGSLLRKTTLDELPNLWCVMKGDMRLVGPRPQVPSYLTNYSADQMLKFTVKPGITGLAQTNGRANLRAVETIACDLEYVRTRTIWLDMKLIFLTAWHVITRRGAY